MDQCHQVNVVVVGFGYGGKTIHCPLIASTPRLKLYGLVVRKPDLQREAQTVYPQAIVFNELEDALNDKEVHLVVISTPHPTHAPLATQSLRARKHVVVDKPMCLTVSECNQMIQAAQDHHVLLSIFHNRRFDGDFLTVSSLQSVVPALSPIRWIEMAWQKHGLSSKLWKTQASIAEGGGTFFDLGAHMIDQLLVLFGGKRVISVHCVMQFLHDASVKSESRAHATLEFDDGSTGVVDTGSQICHSKPRFYVCGDNFTFVKHGVDPQEAALLNGNIDAAQEDPNTYGVLYIAGEQAQNVPTVPGRWRTYYEGIAASILDGIDLQVKPEQIRRVLAVIEACIESASNHKSIQVNI